MRADATERTHGDAVVNGVRLHYVEAGEQGDPLVVLLHGFPEFWYSWRDQLPALADAGFHVVAADMRGYNTSEKPRGVAQYHTDALVGDVLGLIDHFGREEAAGAETTKTPETKPTAHVVGHDWGGVVAWEVGIRHPERVETLSVLNAPHPGRYRDRLRSPDQFLRSWYALFFQLPRLPETLLSARDYAALRRLFREGPVNPRAFDERDVRRYVEAASRPGALTAALDYYRAAFRANLRREFRELIGTGDGRSLDVTVPTLLVWGEQDAALGVELTEGLDRWVPDLRVERLPDASHWVHNDRPERVNELLVEFLRSDGSNDGT